METQARLLVAKTTDTSGDTFTWHGGIATVDLSGVIDGATVTVYLDIGNGFNTNISDLAMTELGLYELKYIPDGALVKATVSGAGGSTELNCLMVDA